MTFFLHGCRCWEVFQIEGGVGVLQNMGNKARRHRDVVREGRRGGRADEGAAEADERATHENKYGWDAGCRDGTGLLRG
jgi:hypothetical protein